MTSLQDNNLTSVFAAAESSRGDGRSGAFVTLAVCGSIVLLVAVICLGFTAREAWLFQPLRPRESTRDRLFARLRRVRPRLGATVGLIALAAVLLGLSTAFNAGPLPSTNRVYTFDMLAEQSMPISGITVLTPCNQTLYELKGMKIDGTTLLSSNETSPGFHCFMVDDAFIFVWLIPTPSGALTPLSLNAAVDASTLLRDHVRRKLTDAPCPPPSPVATNCTSLLLSGPQVDLDAEMLALYGAHSVSSLVSLSVEADEIALSESLYFPGASVSLRASWIAVTDGAVLDVSGVVAGGVRVREAGHFNISVDIGVFDDTWRPLAHAPFVARGAPGNDAGACVPNNGHSVPGGFVAACDATGALPLPPSLTNVTYCEAPVFDKDGNQKQLFYAGTKVLATPGGLASCPPAGTGGNGGAAQLKSVMFTDTGIVTALFDLRGGTSGRLSMATTCGADGSPSHYVWAKCTCSAKGDWNHHAWEYCIRARANDWQNCVVTNSWSPSQSAPTNCTTEGAAGALGRGGSVTLMQTTVDAATASRAESVVSTAEWALDAYRLHSPLGIDLVRAVREKLDLLPAGHPARRMMDELDSVIEQHDARGLDPFGLPPSFLPVSELALQLELLLAASIDVMLAMSKCAAIALSGIALAKQHAQARRLAQATAAEIKKDAALLSTLQSSLTVASQEAQDAQAEFDEVSVQVGAMMRELAAESRNAAEVAARHVRGRMLLGQIARFGIDVCGSCFSVPPELIAAADNAVSSSVIGKSNKAVCAAPTDGDIATDQLLSTTLSRAVKSVDESCKLPTSAPGAIECGVEAARRQLTLEAGARDVAAVVATWLHGCQPSAEYAKQLYDDAMAHSPVMGALAQRVVDLAARVDKFKANVEALASNVTAVSGRLASNQCALNAFESAAAATAPDLTNESTCRSQVDSLMALMQGAARRVGIVFELVSGCSGAGDRFNFGLQMTSRAMQHGATLSGDKTLTEGQAQTVSVDIMTTILSAAASFVAQAPHELVATQSFALSQATLDALNAGQEVELHLANELDMRGMRRPILTTIDADMSAVLDAGDSDVASGRLMLTSATSSASLLSGGRARSHVHDEVPFGFDVTVDGTTSVVEPTARGVISSVVSQLLKPFGGASATQSGAVVLPALTTLTARWSAGRVKLSRVVLHAHVAYIPAARKESAFVVVQPISTCAGDAAGIDVRDARGALLARGGDMRAFSINTPALSTVVAAVLQGSSVTITATPTSRANCTFLAFELPRYEQRRHLGVDGSTTLHIDVGNADVWILARYDCHAGCTATTTMTSTTSTTVVTKIPRASAMSMSPRINVIDVLLDSLPNATLKMLAKRVDVACSSPVPPSTPPPGSEWLCDELLKQLNECLYECGNDNKKSLLTRMRQFLLDDNALPERGPNSRWGHAEYIRSCSKCVRDKVKAMADNGCGPPPSDALKVLGDLGAPTWAKLAARYGIAVKNEISDLVDKIIAKSSDPEARALFADVFLILALSYVGGPAAVAGLLRWAAL